MVGKNKTTRTRAKAKDDATQWFNYLPDSYLERTSRPIYSLVFLVPFIVVYELGTIFFNTDVLSHTQERVVAFVWLQEFLNLLGIGPRYALAAPPLVVVVILIALHVTSRKKWYIHLPDLGPMLVESILLAIPLIVFSLFLNSRVAATPGAAAVRTEVVSRTAAEQAETVSQTTIAAGVRGEAGGAAELSAYSSVIVTDRRRVLPDIITGIGAGIYEELVFRLILVCLLMLVFQDVLRLPWKNALMFSVFISAVLFSLHHHIAVVNGEVVFGDAFRMTPFVFRTLAGVYFAGVFAARGFGITAATHACYDVIATILNAYVISG